MIPTVTKASRSENMSTPATATYQVIVLCFYWRHGGYGNDALVVSELGRTGRGESNVMSSQGCWSSRWS